MQIIDRVALLKPDPSHVDVDVRNVADVSSGRGMPSLARADDSADLDLTERQPHVRVAIAGAALEDDADVA